MKRLRLFSIYWATAFGFLDVDHMSFNRIRPEHCGTDATELLSTPYADITKSAARWLELNDCFAMHSERL